MTPRPTYHRRARGGEELLRDIPRDVGEFRHRELTPAQCQWVANVAMAQAIWAWTEAAGEGDGGYGEDGRWQKWLEGKGAECAAHLELGQPWRAAGANQNLAGQPDLGTSIEVKQTMWPRGNLLLPAAMPADRWGVLVVGIMPHYVLRGCYRAGVSREHPEWRRIGKNGKPVYRVPVGDLLSCDRLEIRNNGGVRPCPPIF